MKFLSYYSGSAGNLYEVISTSGKRLLIDPGVTWSKLQKAIKFDLSNIEGVLCSHSHFDHSKAAENILEAGIALFASDQTLESLNLKEHRRSHIVEDKNLFNVGEDFSCFPFSLEHDAEGTLGFIITERQDNESLLFVTDTFLIKQSFACQFNIIAICCNYDIEWLRQKVEMQEINETYAKRLIESHMEKETAKNYIRDYCNLDKCTEIHLLHMSGSNIDKEKVRAEFEKEFFIKTFIA